MNRKFGTGRLRAAATAALVFAAMLLGAAAPSAASTYTLAYTATVTSVGGIGGGVFNALHVKAGDAVTGSLTLDPFNEVYDYTGGGNSTFPQTSSAFTFHVEHPDKLDFTFSDAGDGEIITAGTPHSVSGLRFDLFGADSALELTFQTAATGGPLTSLSGLPTTATGLIAMFGGNLPSATGYFNLRGYGQVYFDVAFTAVAATPIPAALPLFVSALGGLGFAGWRRQRAA